MTLLTFSLTSPPPCGRRQHLLRMLTEIHLPRALMQKNGHIFLCHFFVSFILRGLTEVAVRVSFPVGLKV